MILETERLILRPFTENDTADAFEKSIGKRSVSNAFLV